MCLRADPSRFQGKRLRIQDFDALAAKFACVLAQSCRCGARMCGCIGTCRGSPFLASVRTNIPSKRSASKILLRRMPP